ncbi:50S ribosomal protein L34e [Candidatus Woesearchaeota archaeon]|nr:50S ribosomal protein L34e [Candidatus Woesearchaeota archaeon]
MVRRALRSRTLRRVKVKTPGNSVKTHFRKRKPKIAHCGKCGAILKGIARETPRKIQNMPKTRKKVMRPFSGVLCTKCSRALFKEKAKSLR